MIDLSTVLNVAETFGILIGVVFAVIQIRNISRTRETELETRQAQLFMQIYDNFHKTEFFDKFTDILTWKWIDYNDFQKKYGRKADPKAWNYIGSCAAYFEGIGVLVNRNLLNVDLVGQLMARHVVAFWEKIEPISKEMRSRLKMPVDIGLEYLYNEIKPVMEQQLLELK